MVHFCVPVSMQWPVESAATDAQALRGEGHAPVSIIRVPSALFSSNYPPLPTHSATRQTRPTTFATQSTSIPPANILLPHSLTHPHTHTHDHPAPKPRTFPGLSAAPNTVQRAGEAAAWLQKSSPGTTPSSMPTPPPGSGQGKVMARDLAGGRRMGVVVVEKRVKLPSADQSCRNLPFTAGGHSTRALSAHGPARTPRAPSI